MEWETYLEQKKIDADGWQKAEPAEYQKMKDLFYQMSPNSFTAQKLFLINSIRRKFLLKAKS